METVVKYGKQIVEQVDKDGNITYGLDCSLTSSEIYENVVAYFPNINIDNDGIMNGRLDGKRYSLRIKNVTYLGIPHPIFKKRIQIADDLQEFYRLSIEKGYTPLLLGIYENNDVLLFCDFRIEDFIGKKAHNSSAHIYTSDLADAIEDGYFEKTDYFGNRIAAFTPDNTISFLRNRLFLEDETASLYQSEEREEEIPVVGFPKEISNHIWRFFKNEEKVWCGIGCYKKMIADDYRNKFQAEWPGYFLEYEFENYIERNRIQHLVQYYQDKTEGGIDLDLYFPIINNFGDLKAHSENSRGIQGNAWNTVTEAINNYGHVYYIVCEHSTKKDSECGYVVTRYWNEIRGKSNLMSYSKRMKNMVMLKRAMILDINAENKVFLSVFRQGINSNGKPRKVKVMIEMSNIEHFIIGTLAME